MRTLERRLRDLERALLTRWRSWYRGRTKSARVLADQGSGWASVVDEEAVVALVGEPDGQGEDEDEGDDLGNALEEPAGPLGVGGVVVAELVKVLDEVAFLGASLDLPVEGVGAGSPYSVDPLEELVQHDDEVE